MLALESVNKDQRFLIFLLSHPCPIYYGIKEIHLLCLCLSLSPPLPPSFPAPPSPEAVINLDKLI